MVVVKLIETFEKKINVLSFISVAFAQIHLCIIMDRTSLFLFPLHLNLNYLVLSCIIFKF